MIRSRTAVATVAVLPALALCAVSRSAVAAPAATGGAGVCRNAIELKRAVGRRCSVTGVYTLKRFPAKGGGPVAEPWPIVTLADGTEVMIGSVWDPAQRPDVATIAELTGKKVEASGVVNAAPPRSGPQNFAFLCLSPVARVRRLPAREAAVSIPGFQSSSSSPR